MAWAAAGVKVDGKSYYEGFVLNLLMYRYVQCGENNILAKLFYNH